MIKRVEIIISFLHHKHVEIVKSIYYQLVNHYDNYSDPISFYRHYESHSLHTDAFQGIRYDAMPF